MGNQSPQISPEEAPLPAMPTISLEKQKLSDSVYQIISEYIIQGKLQQGQRLREAEVARELDVSRTPVREAFARLEAERLLERDPTGAYLVTTWDRKRFLELATVRSTLECLAVRIACLNLQEHDYDYLQNIIDRMAIAYQREHFSRLVQLDIDFHSYIWSKTDHTLLKNLLESIKIQILYFMYLTLPGDEEEYASMHQTLLNSIKSRNPQNVDQTMSDHIILTAEPAIDKLGLA